MRSGLWFFALTLSALCDDLPEAAPVSTTVECEACATAEEQTRFSARFAGERLARWQQRLKLEEWNITITMTRRSELKPKTLGGIRWDKRKKTASISVLDPSEYRLPFAQVLDDIELTIVHELVHLGLASLPRSEASRSSEEHAVNRMAEALISLDRRK